MNTTIYFNGYKMDVEYDIDPELYIGACINSVKLQGDSVDWSEFLNDDALVKIERLVYLQDLT